MPWSLVTAVVTVAGAERRERGLQERLHREDRFLHFDPRTNGPVRASSAGSAKGHGYEFSGERFRYVVRRLRTTHVNISA